MVKKPRWIGVHLLAAAVVLSGMPRIAFAGQEIGCESHGLRRAYCPTGRHGTVRLLDSSGMWPCTENKTWGVETEGIWVDKGCKGRFFVDNESSRSDRHAAAAVAGIVGIGVLAAILANKNNKRDEVPSDAFPNPDTSPDAVPYWAVGHYHGYTPSTREESTLVVGSNGGVLFAAGRNQTRASWIGNDQIRTEQGTVYFLSRSADGLRVAPASNRRAYTDYYRER